MTARPTFRLTPPETSNAAPEAIDLAATAGLFLDPWQQDEMRNALGERADGSWSAAEVGIVLPRQNGKGEILLARELAGLFLFGERLIIHSAHEFRTAQDAYRRLLELIEGNPDLDSRVKRKLNNTTETSVELHTGQRVRFVSRTKGAGRGLTGDVVILDEAYKLPAEAMEALVPTMAARPNRQLWYTSSAPLDAVESDTLRRLCRRGRDGRGDRLAYSEWCVPAKSHEDVDLTDRALWHQANPSMLAASDHAIEEEAVETELQSMTAEGFARERLGIVDLDSEIFAVIPAAAWSECLDGPHRPARPLSYSLDVSPESRSCSIAMSDGTHVEVVKHAPGTAWVVDACREKRSEFSEIVLDPAGPAGVLVAPLTAAGIVLREVSTREAVQACEQFLAAVTDGAVKVPDHPFRPDLDRAVANADRRDVGDGGWLWSRKRSTVDISPLYAVTLAKWAAGATAPVPTPGFVDLNDFDEE